MRTYKKRRSEPEITAGDRLVHSRVESDQRPTTFDDRQAFGHRESESIVGFHRKESVVNVLERKTRQHVCFPVNHRTKEADSDDLSAFFRDIKDAGVTTPSQATVLVA